MPLIQYIMYKPNGKNERPMDSMYDKALKLYDSGRYGEALSEIDHAIAFHPHNIDCHILRSHIHSAMNHHDLAIEAARYAISLDPKNDDARLTLILILINEEKFGEVLSECNSALAEIPDAPELYIYKGLAYCQLDQHDDALKSYMKAAQLNPSDSTPHFEMASILYDRSQYSKALREVNIGLRFSRMDEDARVLRVDILLGMGNEKEAMLEIERSLKLIPKSTDLAERKAEILYDRGEYAQYIETLISAFYRNHDPDLLIEATDFLSEMGLYEEVLNIIDEAIKVSDDSALKVEKLVAFEELDRLDESLKQADEWIKCGGDTERLEEERIRILIYKDEGELAETEARNLFEKYQKSETSLSVLLESLDYNEKPEEIVRLVDTFIQDNYESPNLLRSKSMAFAQMKRYEDQLQCIRRIMTIAGENDIDLIAEVNALYRMNRLDEALESLGRVRGDSPVDTYVILMRARIIAKKENIQAGMEILRKSRNEDNKQLLWETAKLQNELAEDQTTSELLKQYLSEFDDARESDE